MNTIPIQESMFETKTILLVENNEIVRTFLRTVLEMNGYKVIEAENCIAAITMCNENKNAIHLLLTEVTLPEMNGIELTRLVQIVCPEMRVLYMSGYSRDNLVNDLILDDKSNHIQKPFNIDDLMEKVRAVLCKVNSENSLTGVRNLF